MTTFIAHKFQLEFDPDNRIPGPWYLAQLKAAMDRNFDGPLHISIFKEYLMRQATDFDVRKYQYKKFSDFLQNYVLNLTDQYELDAMQGPAINIIPKKKGKMTQGKPTSFW